MANELDDLRAEVQETKGTIDSAIALIQGLKARLDEALNSGDVTAAIKELRESLDKSQQDLAAAVLANPIPGEQTQEEEGSEEEPAQG